MPASHRPRHREGTGIRQLQTCRRAAWGKFDSQANSPSYPPSASFRLLPPRHVGVVGRHEATTCRMQPNSCLIPPDSASLPLACHVSREHRQPLGTTYWRSQPRMCPTFPAYKIRPMRRPRSCFRSYCDRYRGTSGNADAMTTALMLVMSTRVTRKPRMMPKLLARSAMD